MPKCKLCKEEVVVEEGCRERNPKTGRKEILHYKCFMRLLSELPEDAQQDYYDKYL